MTAYHHRFRRVLAYIDAHLGGDVSLERLAEVAAFSKYHFHRQFSAIFGIGVHPYVQLVRMKSASYQLAFREHERILDVALTSGYESHEAFSRAFKKIVGQTPSEFRQQPQWETWHAIYERLHDLRTNHMTSDHRPDDVKIVEFPETRIGVLRHRGDPRRIGDSLRAFIDWRKQNRLHPKTHATFNLLYDDPATTPPDEFRLDFGSAVDGPVGPNAFGVVEQTIPAGRCAVLRHVGPDDTFRESFGFLYATWLPTSGEEPRDFPLFLQRITLFPDVPEHEAITDIFLPLR